MQIFVFLEAFWVFPTVGMGVGWGEGGKVPPSSQKFAYSPPPGKIPPVDSPHQIFIPSPPKVNPHPENFKL